MSEFNYEVKEHVAVLSENESGYSIQVNVVSYNGRKPKLDIRTWREGKMLKGICLDAGGARKLKAALEDFDMSVLE